MSRRSKPKKRVPLADALYNDVQVAKFINALMTRGKKVTAEKVFYGALAELESKGEKEPLTVFHQAIQKVRPLVRVKARRVGGSTYQVPIEVREDEGTAIAFRWLRDNARSRKGRSMVNKLAGEIADAAKGQGNSVKKREDTHRMAEANKAFAHYRF